MDEKRNAESFHSQGFSAKVMSIWWLHAHTLIDNSEARIWFYTPEIDSDLIMSHKIQSAAFTCIVHQSKLSNVLHISKPTNSLYPDDVRLILYT